MTGVFTAFVIAVVFLVLTTPAIARRAPYEARTALSVIILWLAIAATIFGVIASVLP